MKLIFNCLKTCEAFETAAYAIVNDHGVRTDPEGKRFFDAQVMLDGPCPYCGERHVYPVSHMGCPFGS